jgi:hypothetical protein
MKKMNWFQQHRLEWIAETLRVFGFINRQHIMRKFSMSMPQASLDLALFQKLHPGVAEYDLTAKRFVPRKQPERKPDGKRP